jgi:hypothetical protein
MERRRFVDAIRQLIPPLERLPGIPDDSGYPTGEDLYAGATYRLGDDLIDVSETQPNEGMEFHEVKAEFTRNNINRSPKLPLRYRATYTVNPTQGWSLFNERVRPARGRIVPMSDEAFLQQLQEAAPQAAYDTLPVEFTFSPQRLAVIMPLIAQCHRGNFIAITDH